MGKAAKLLDKSRVWTIFILALVLLISSTANISFSKETKEYDQIKVMNFAFDFCEPELKDILLNEGTYTKISMKNCLSFSEPGEPSLPTYPVKILLPPNCELSKIDVSYTSKINVKSDVKEKPIAPQQLPIKIGFDDTQVFTMNEKTYQSSKLIKNELFSSVKIDSCRGYDILSLSLNPVNYNPGEGKIFYYPELEISIKYKEENSVNSYFRSNFDDEQWIRNLVINPEQTTSYSTLSTPIFEYENGLCNESENYDYVIITTTQNNLNDWSTNTTLHYNWTSLMDKHNEDYGFDCTLVTIQDIINCTDYWNDTALFNDTPAKIREFCRDAYLDWDTSYILIGGDDELIPAREMDYSYESDVDSDIYWSNLDKTFNNDQDTWWGEEGDTGFDLYAELFIGRIPCDEPQDVSNWLNKSFTYSNSNNISYLENAGFYGGDTGWNTEGDDFLEFSAINGTLNWTGPNPGNHGQYPNWLGFLYGFQTWNQKHPNMPFNLSEKWTADNPNPGWQGGNSNSAIAGFRNAINNNQVTLISGNAHANEDMSLDVASADWEANYHNTLPFLIYDYGCHCGDMDAAEDGVLHSMLFHSDTELAFACIYNTGFGWGSYSDTNSSSALLQKLFWDYFFDIENNSGSRTNWTLGKAMAYSKDAMAPTINWTYIGAPGSWRSVIQGCLLFGDPAQMIRAPYISQVNGTISLTNEQPTNQSITEDIGYIALSVNVYDSNGDQMNISFFTNASGNWSLIGSNNSRYNGTYNQVYEFNNYSTRYFWSVNVTDSTGHSSPINETYCFTTRAIHNVGIVENFTSTTLNGRSINLSWSKGENATNTHIERNTTANWTKGDGIEIYNDSGNYFIDNNLSENTVYYYRAWSWDNIDNVWNQTNASTSNNTDWNNLPTLSSANPTNKSTDISINKASLRINIIDEDGDIFNWSIETNPDIGSSYGNNETNGTKICNVSDLSYSTTYYWHVNVSEVGNNTWVNRTFNFKIENRPSSRSNNRDSSSHDAAVNGAPKQPDRPSGEIEGYAGTSYTYTSKTTDPENNNIKYKFDWGDGNTSEWSNYFNSGEEISMKYTWENNGEYKVTVIAKDSEGELSDWSKELTVKIYEVVVFEEDIDFEIDISSNNLTNETINFNLSIENMDDVSLTYYWNFGDGNFSSEKQPNHSYSQSGDYVVSLMIYDENGNLLANETHQITIIDSSSSIANDLNKTDKQEQKFDYFVLFILFFSFVFILILMIVYNRLKTTNLNHNNFSYSHSKIKHLKRSSNFFISPKKGYNKRKNPNYNYDLNNNHSKKIYYYSNQPSYSKYPESHHQRIREQIDDLLAKLEKNK